jgi:hypothetical protein
MRNGSFLRQGVPGSAGGQSKMEEFKKILVLDNEIEAQLMASILMERNIPHRMKSYHDSAYDGIFQVQKGWGHIEAPLNYKEEIMAIRADLPLRNHKEDLEANDA